MSDSDPTKNTDLHQRRIDAVPRGVASVFPIFIERAENAEAWDVEGRRYLDFAGGIGTLNLGHRHPRVAAAAHAQMDRVMHTAFQVAGYEPYIALAERLNAAAPLDGPAKTLLMSTGAEALENVVKIARVATGRRGVISFVGGFHGRSLLALALTGKVLPYKHSFGPLPGDVFHAPFPNPLHGISIEDSLQAIHRIFKASIEPEQVAAIAFEPVQGEGGFYVAPFEWIQALRELCDTHGILLVSDEVQSGFTRTGPLFAIQHSGVTPDLITVAKSLAGGLPLSGVIGRAEVMDAVPPGGLGGTYGGNPVACAAALAVMDAIESEGLVQRASQLGEHMREALSALQTKHAFIGEVRGLGPMLALEYLRDGRPAPEIAKAVSQEALRRGLIILPCGIYGNVTRILVPVTAPDAQIHEGLGILAACLDEVSES
ncbi:MAG: 4-aminobutyrate--2-oxoglutarate transaminase [Myxococcota bacterium]